VIAHEMAHIITFKHANWSGDPHDAQFVALARVIEADMGWPKGSV
jgi:predicted SprT family Zn-dependent metalloprotease